MSMNYLSKMNEQIMDWDCIVNEMVVCIENFKDLNHHDENLVIT